jgi:hypothetical protein
MGGQNPSSAEAFAEAMEMNETLTHLNIAYNKFSKAEVETLAGKLNVNHTLKGLHVEGNAGFYDHKGYLWPRDPDFHPKPMLAPTLGN